MGLFIVGFVRVCVRSVSLSVLTGDGIMQLCSVGIVLV